MADKSERRRGAWEFARELDRVALPMIESLGVKEAYRRAVEEVSGPASGGFEPETDCAGDQGKA